MNSLSKDQLLAFQDRWMRPAGLAALAAAFISVGGVIVQHAGLHFPGGNSDADQLAFVHAHSSRLILAAVIQAIGILLYAVPLNFLYRAAAARAERMRGRWVVLTWLGPLLLGTALIVISIAGRHVSDDFVKQAPAAEQQAREQVQHQPGTATAHSTATTTPSATTTAQANRTPAQAANDARENLADDVGKNYALASVAGLLQLMGILGVLFAFVYTALWTMRTGLLTRGVGFLGILAGFLLVIPLLGPLSGLAVVIWFAIVGLMFLGVWIRRLPPAWAAGEAIPWPRPGEDLGPPPEEGGPSGTVEGSGRQVSSPEPPEGDDERDQLASGETQGQRRKKRKRRR